MTLFPVMKHGKKRLFLVFPSKALGLLKSHVLQWWNSVLLWLKCVFWLMDHFYWNLLILQVALTNRDISSSKWRYVNLFKFHYYCSHFITCTLLNICLSVVFICLPGWEFISKHYIWLLLIALIDRLNYLMIVSSHQFLFQGDRIL